MATAIESMTGINVSSSYFSSPAILELFPKHPKPSKSNRVALLYGKNGSGKSTIAQGFREYRDSINPRTVTLTPLANSASIKITPTGKPEKFYIFDEDYISSRVKIRDSGLNAIVLLGEQVSLDEKIDKIEVQLKKKKEEVSAQEAECLRYENNNDVTSPKHWLSKMCDTLKETDGWADIGSRIKGQKVKLAVNQTEILRIAGLKPDKPIDELKKDFKSLFTRFSAIDANTALLPQNSFCLPDTTTIESSVISMLSKTIEKPQLTHREQEILNLFGLQQITEVRTFLADMKNNICDKCLQTISDEYRAETLQEIDGILNREIEEFKSGLMKLQVSEIPAEAFRIYSNLPSFEALCTEIDSYNKSVHTHNAAIQEKFDNPFSPHSYSQSIGLTAIANSLSTAFKKLKIEIDDFNQMVNDKSKTQKSLLIINDSIAHLMIEKDFATFQAQQDVKNYADEKRQQLLAQQTILETNKAMLDMKRKNYLIAADEINESLKYIFFSDKRLTIELGNDQLYHLKSNGVTVNPSNVSCGERNAIALCYYFAEIAKDMDAKAKYTDELLLVIDDPISSFDVENRIGILSFLRWKLEQVLDGCTTTKVLLMTHDVSVIFDLEKALEEISKHCEKISTYAQFRVFQLKNKLLLDFSHKSHNEYSQLLHMMYQYALNENDELDLVIGNVMRRVLEAFASFSYKKGIIDVSLDDKVINLLPNQTSKTYYRNLMYRLVLNTESHAEEGMQGAPETSFFSHLSSSEKQRTAKDILCFIYCLNKTHLLSHLTEAEADLDKWSATIGT
ncbi:AAA family ATPase [Oscillibacter sp.]|uniref:AAA family ATPase n=1 Tax=Oscillibacter sp. TaxID=1945593 RepID=UPI0028A6B213|nr:AAA family ATPase [Oscillibacter sp.]